MFTSARLRRGRQRAGATLVLVAILVAILLGMVAFVVDLSYLSAKRSQLQSAADAAALAGATSLGGATSPAQTIAQADHYAKGNVTGVHTVVTLGQWDPQARHFTPWADPPNAVKAELKLTAANNNPVPAYFARMFGRDHFDLTRQAIAAGVTPNATSSDPADTKSVYVTSTKDLSNVVLHFADGAHQKFDGLSSYTGTFSGTGEHAGKALVGVWIKSGCYMSGDGPGYGEYVEHPGDGTTVHGNEPDRGCTAHVTATFGSDGATHTDSGSHGPIRLVQ